MNELESRDHPNATPHSLLTGPLTQNWSNTALITADNNWSTVPSIQGFRGDNLTTGVGVDPRTILADGSGTPISVLANRPNTNLITGGVGEFHLANPVVGLQGSDVADAPHLVLYLNTTSVSGVMVSFKLRDIDGSANNAVQQVAVQYRVGGGAWANVPGGYVADATAGPSLSGGEIPVSVVLPSNADDQSNVQVRILTTNAVGIDEWVGIDDIVVTRDHTINKWTGSGLFSTATNWSLGRAPIPNDVVVFDGSASNSQCIYDGTSAASSFAYVRLVNSFSGTLRLESSMEVGTVELTTGTIDQPTASPFTIGDLFTWTGGTLNSTSTLASVYFDGGSMANITPGAGNTIATGSTLIFGNDGVSVGSTGNFSPGTIEFRNDSGLEINEFCVAEVGVAKADIIFKDKNAVDLDLPAKGQIKVVGGTFRAKVAANETTGKFEANLTISASKSGTVKVDKGATVKLTGKALLEPVAQADRSVVIGESAKLIIEGGGLLEAVNGVDLAGGEIAAVATRHESKDLPALIATIKGNVGFHGGIISINADSNPHVFGRLNIEGKLFWQSGTFETRIGSKQELEADLLDVSDEIQIAGFEGTKRTVDVKLVGNINDVNANTEWRAIGTAVGVVTIPGTLSDITVNAPWKLNAIPVGKNPIIGYTVQKA